MNILNRITPAVFAVLFIFSTSIFSTAHAGANGMNVTRIVMEDGSAFTVDSRWKCDYNDEQNCWKVDWALEGYTASHTYTAVRTYRWLYLDRIGHDTRLAFNMKWGTLWVSSLDGSDRFKVDYKMESVSKK